MGTPVGELGERGALPAGPLRSPAWRSFRLRLQNLGARWRGPGWL
ncbi:hypothetical protein ABTX85_37470 [Streptomyces sp. NPDC096097]